MNLTFDRRASQLIEMDLPLQPTEPTPLTDINTISDELLLQILALVPYPGPELPDTAFAIKQHDAMKLVSSRFNSVMSTAAFRMEMLRRQYNAEIQLYGIQNCITTQRLRELVTHAAKIDALVENMPESKSDDQVQSMLRLSLLVLDYQKIMNNSPSIKARMKFIKWANETMFSPLVRAVLRHTLNRLHDTIGPAAILDISNQFDGTTQSALSSLGEPVASLFAQIVQIVKYRNFETFILFLSDPMSLPAILEVEDIANIRRNGGQMLMLLHVVSQYLLQKWSTRGPVQPVLTKQHSDYVAGYHWRPLSDRNVWPLTSGEEEVGQVVIQAFSEEMYNDEKGDKFIMANSTTPEFGSLLIMDLRAVGEFLRTATARIEEEDESIPESVSLYADEATHLQGL